MKNKDQLLKRRKEVKSLLQKLQVKHISSIFKNYCDNKSIVLEVGCGYGFFSEIVSQYCSSLYATDINDYFPSSLKKKKKIKYYKNVDAQKLPYKNNYFDIVYSIDVVEHIENDIAFINENLRVLKKGGKLIIGTPNRNRLINFILKKLKRERKYPLCVGKDMVGNDVIHLREYYLDEIMNLLNKSSYNIKIEKIRGLSFGILGHFEIPCPLFLLKYCQFWLIVIKKCN